MLAKLVGIPTAAKQLGLHESQLYCWRTKERLKQKRSDVEQKLALENTRLKRQLAEQAEELAILEKATAYFAKSTEVKYAFMLDHSGKFRVTTMCRVLDASRRGFYA